MVKNGKIRLTQNGQTLRAKKSHTLVRPGDALSFMRGTELIHVEITACAARRGPAKEAQSLYETLEQI